MLGHRSLKETVWRINFTEKVEQAYGKTTTTKQHSLEKKEFI